MTTPEKCKCPKCPQCGNELERVTQSSWSMLNAEQFDVVRAGDYYCEVCPDNGRGNGRKCYWWERVDMGTPEPSQQSTIDALKLENKRLKAVIAEDTQVRLDMGNEIERLQGVLGELPDDPRTQFRRELATPSECGTTTFLCLRICSRRNRPERAGGEGMQQLRGAKTYYRQSLQGAERTPW